MHRQGKPSRFRGKVLRKSKDEGGFYATKIFLSPNNAFAAYSGVVWGTDRGEVTLESAASCDAKHVKVVQTD